MLEQAVIVIAAKDEDRDEMRAHLDEALDLSFITSGPQDMYYDAAINSVPLHGGN